MFSMRALMLSALLPVGSAVQFPAAGTLHSDGTGYCYEHTKGVFPMTDCFAWQDWMLKYFPVAVKYELNDLPGQCVQRSELYVDDGGCEQYYSDPAFYGERHPNSTCLTPFQLHIVCAPGRETGGKSLMQLEEEITEALGDVSTYSPFLDYSYGFVTLDLNAYIRKFDAEGVRYWATAFDVLENDATRRYYSIVVPTPASPDGKRISFVNFEVFSNESTLLEKRGVGVSPIPRATPGALARAYARLALVRRALSENGLPVFAYIQAGFASSNLARDRRYFEDVQLGVEVPVARPATSADGAGTSAVYFGFMGNPEIQNVSADRMPNPLLVSSGLQPEYRFTESPALEGGFLMVRQREEYLRSLHRSCFDSESNQGFDALADLHMQCHTSDERFEELYQLQVASGLPYRFYTNSRNDGTLWFYMYGPNGQGNEITGKVPDSAIWQKLRRGEMGYNFCRQGTRGTCGRDLNRTEGADLGTWLADAMAQPDAEGQWPCFSRCDVTDEVCDLWSPELGL